MRAFALTLLTLITGSIVSGCAVATSPQGGPVQVMVPTRREPTSTGTLVYACQGYPGTCLWYRHGSNVVAGTLSGVSFPVGITVDNTGNVYVACQDTRSVLVYAKATSTPMKTLTDPRSGSPVDVAVAPDGTVYVAEEQGYIAVYTGGSTTPTSYLTDPDFVFDTQSVAVDEHHLVAVLYDDLNFQVDVDEFVGGKGHGVKVISTGVSGGSVRFDGADNLVLALDAGSGEIEVYNGKTFALCNTIPQPGLPGYIGLDRRNGDMYIADVRDKIIHEETFGDCTSGGTIERNYTAGLMTDGVVSTAIDPGPGP